MVWSQIVTAKAPCGRVPRNSQPRAKRRPGAPELYHNISKFVSLQGTGKRLFCVMKDQNGRPLRFPVLRSRGLPG